MLTNQRMCWRTERVRGEIKQTHEDSHRDSHQASFLVAPLSDSKAGNHGKWQALSLDVLRTSHYLLLSFRPTPLLQKEHTVHTHSDNYTADTRTHIHTLVFTRTLIPAHMHSYTCTHTHTGSHPCTHIHSNSRIHALYTHILTRVHTHTHLLAQALTPFHANTQRGDLYHRCFPSLASLTVICLHRQPFNQPPPTAT